MTSSTKLTLANPTPSQYYREEEKMTKTNGSVSTKTVNENVVSYGNRKGWATKCQEDYNFTANQSIIPNVEVVIGTNNFETKDESYADDQEDCTMNAFEVTVEKNMRGIGFSICGGIDADNESECKSIRVKKLFPSEPAAGSGIQVGDIILKVNNCNMMNLTIREAVDVMHASGTEVKLLIVRPSSLNIPSRRPMLPQDIKQEHLMIEDEATSLEDNFEYEVTLVKKDGTLGFTIVKIENEGLFVKDLIKEPALSAGCIKPADRIVLVNGIEVSSMSHSAAITFLRNLPDKVTLLLRRVTKYETMNDLFSSLDDDDVTRSPPKPLRHEALMLSDKSRGSQSPNRLKRRKKRKSRELDVKNDDNVNEVDLEEIKIEIDDDIMASDENGRMHRNNRPMSLNNKTNQLRTVEDFDEDELINEVNNISKLLRQFSAVEKVRHELQVNGDDKQEGALSRWRGMTLSTNNCDSDCENENDNDYVNRDEQDSGFGESTGSKSHCIDDDINRHQLAITNNNNHLVEVCIDRGWHGRLGFALVDNDNLTKNCSNIEACCVREVFPNSVASKDGRIKVGDKLIQVNGESTLSKPAKEVIDTLRKTRGKVKLLFVRMPQQSDL